MALVAAAVTCGSTGRSKVAPVEQQEDAGGSECASGGGDEGNGAPVEVGIDRLGLRH